MISESVTILTLILLAAQSSSLWSSLITIPFSTSIIFMMSEINVQSGSTMMIFIMVFIGGLLVLLVSVAVISHMEQGYNFSKTWMMFSMAICSPFLFEFQNSEGTASFITLGAWLESQSCTAMIFIIMLLTALFSISLNLMTFTGLIRKL